MAKTLIIDEGKTEVLRLSFKNDDSRGGFDYIALGGANSAGAQKKEFAEITDSSYQRAQTTVDSLDDKSISISAIFDETNLNSSNGELITEIGLVNSSEYSGEEVFFTYCEVPNITKDDSISLKYTIIIEIE